MRKDRSERIFALSVCVVILVLAIWMGQNTEPTKVTPVGKFNSGPLHSKLHPNLCYDANERQVPCPPEDGVMPDSGNPLMFGVSMHKERNKPASGPPLPK
jgi:hypothetical protein